MPANYAVLFLGPAGSGKSSLCTALLEHFTVLKRNACLVNLDPAVEHTHFAPAFDIRDVRPLSRMMDETDCGPNGGLIRCLESLLDDGEWLQENLSDRDGDFALVDCPGQIEIYTHSSIMQRITDIFHQKQYRVCAIHLLEAHFLQDSAKFVAGALNALSAMLRLEIPYLNVVSKIDLINPLEMAFGTAQDEKTAEMSEEEFLEAILDEDSVLHRYFCPDPVYLAESIHKRTSSQHRKLTEALVDLVDEYQMLHFFPVSVKNKTSIDNLLLHIDNTLQYADDAEVVEAEFE